MNEAWYCKKSVKTEWMDENIGTKADPNTENVQQNATY